MQHLSSPVNPNLTENRSGHKFRHMTTPKKSEPNEPLIQLRQYLGLSQRDFAKPLGMSGSRIAHLELGDDPIGRITVLRIIDTYRKAMRRAKVTPEELMRGYFISWGDV